MVNMNDTDTRYNYYDEGMEFLHIHEYDSAIEKFTEAIEQNKNDATSLYYYRGLAFEGKNDHNAARKDFLKALRLCLMAVEKNDNEITQKISQIFSKIFVEVRQRCLESGYDYVEGYEHGQAKGIEKAFALWESGISLTEAKKRLVIELMPY